MIYQPGNNTTFPAGIGLPTRQVNPLEGTGLDGSRGRKEKPTVCKTGPYLTARMNRCRTHVIFASRVPFDLWVRSKHLSIE
jgi:hypothetical protein